MGVSAAVHPTDPILQAHGLGKLDDLSAESVDKHLESCPVCRHRVAELTSDEFLGRLHDAKVASDHSAAGRSPFGVSSTQGNRGPVDPPLPVATLPPELVEHPDYEIVRELGRGGMGVVYLARNKLMGRLEVLKVVSGHLLERPGVRDRFLREVQSAAKLHHKNIVAAYTAMKLGESIVLAMEYIDGEDLAKMVKSRGPLSVVHACYFIHQAALGLQHAHERGMVHRDIKPANLIFATDGKKGIVKVLDFGLAKVTNQGQTDRGLTREGQMLGTPDYIAPEQIRDAQSADIRADIYSLGCTLYYLLTGGPPFRGEHLWDLYQAHFSIDATPLNLVRTGVPVELAAAVAKMMAKEPRRRFQTPGEVARALAPFFKAGSDGTRVSNPQSSRIRQPEGKPESSAQGSEPAQPVTNRAPATASPVKKTGATAHPEPNWESLIESRETVSAKEPGPGVVAIRRQIPRWLLPAVAACVLVAGLAVAWEMSARVESTNGTKDGLEKYGVEVNAQAKSKEQFTLPFGIPTTPRPQLPNGDAQKSINHPIGMTLKLIPAGTFMMGSSETGRDAKNDEIPQHPVRITRPFYLGADEVTQAQYEAVMGSNPSYFPENRAGNSQVAGQSTERHPVENVSWLDAVTFCNGLSEKEGLAAFYEIDGGKVTVSDWDGPGYRLPTEAEWEYACRANTLLRYSFGDDMARLGEFAWYDGNSERKTHAVGEKQPNRFGLFDMHGNVFEWCWDGYGEAYYKESPLDDPRGVDGAPSRVIRGGAWTSGPKIARTAYRYWRVTGFRRSNQGFRVARNQPFR